MALVNNETGAKMKILVTGTEGYLGCLLAPELIRRGHEVTGVDTGYYRNGWLYNGVDVTAKTLAKDIRNITVEDLEGFDAVVHMAELSNDPLGQLAPDVTYLVNHQGSVKLANLAIEAASSASSTCPPAASTGSPTAPSTRARRSTRRPPTRSARPWSSAI
jgi:nucleoside-diphosphate-sugar epimerase